LSDLRELYQEVILDHSKRPRNFGKPAAANREAKGHNPLCGDRLTVYALVDGDRIADLAFVGDGCAISKASASLMTETVKGRSVAEAKALFGHFHETVTAKDEVALPEELDRLQVFAGVREFPMRVKCATLPWHTLQAALDGSAEPVKTE
jgi:nitrogen fixation protein NifU and related proteins